MSQKLIIEWDRSKVSVQPFTESFFCKSIEAAEKIVDSRGRENILFAAWHVSRGFPKRTAVVLIDKRKYEPETFPEFVEPPKG